MHHTLSLLLLPSLQHPLYKLSFLVAKKAGGSRGASDLAAIGGAWEAQVRSPSLEHRRSTGKRLQLAAAALCMQLCSVA
jgi:hypothetical protein